MTETTQSNATRLGALWSNELNWLLGEADSALGSRGSMQSVISMIEHGGASPGSDHEHVTDQQLGWGRCLVSSSARWRPLWARWRRLDGESQRIHAAHYSGVQLPPGIEVAFRVLDARSDGSGSKRICVGAVALMLAGSIHAAKLIAAARWLDGRPQGWERSNVGRQAAEVLEGPRKRAEQAVRAAHSAWTDTAPESSDQPISKSEARRQRVEEFVRLELG